MIRLLSFAFIMPMSLAMALAVMALSPVTIRTFIPAWWHLAIAPGTYFLGMSLTPKIPTTTRSLLYTSKTPFPSFFSKLVSLLISL